MKIILGSHVSFSKTSNYLLGAGYKTISNGANAFMIFLGPPNSTARSRVEEYKLKEFLNEYSNKIKLKDIVIHGSYIINPSSLDKANFAEELLISDAKRMNYIGAKIMVVHPGSSTKFNRKESMNRLVKTMKNVIKKTKNIIFCLETMSGKGTETGKTLEELAYVMEEVNSDRIGICLDTCHLWDAGYDLGDINGIIIELKKLNILKKIKVLHINDSKNNLGSAKDRHENIGKGFIGLENLKLIVHEKEFQGLPMILETPHINGEDIYAKEINMLISV